MDPVSIGSGFMSGLKSLQGGAGGAAGPSAARGGNSDSIFDSSGWTVVFGDGNTTEASRAGELGGYLPYLLAGAAVLIVWRMTRKA